MQSPSLLKDLKANPDIRLSSHSYAHDLSLYVNGRRKLICYDDAELAMDIIFDHVGRWRSAGLQQIFPRETYLSYEGCSWDHLICIAAPLLQSLWFHSERYIRFPKNRILRGGSLL
jgi:hypothetical protein